MFAAHARRCADDHVKENASMIFFAFVARNFAKRSTNMSTTRKSPAWSDTFSCRSIPSQIHSGLKRPVYATQLGNPLCLFAPPVAAARPARAVEVGHVVSWFVYWRGHRRHRRCSRGGPRRFGRRRGRLGVVAKVKNRRRRSSEYARIVGDAFAATRFVTGENNPAKRIDRYAAG